MPEIETPQQPETPGDAGLSNPPSEADGKDAVGEATTTEDKTEIIRFGLMNIISPAGIFTLLTAMTFDAIGGILTLLDLVLGVGEIFSWLIPAHAKLLTMS